MNSLQYFEAHEPSEADISRMVVLSPSLLLFLLLLLLLLFLLHLVLVLIMVLLQRV